MCRKESGAREQASQPSTSWHGSSSGAVVRTEILTERRPFNMPPPRRRSAEPGSDQPGSGRREPRGRPRRASGREQSSRPHAGVPSGASDQRKSNQRMNVAGSSESAWTPFSNVNHFRRVPVKWFARAGQCPPVCSSVNWQARYTGALILFTNVIGASRSWAPPGRRSGWPGSSGAGSRPRREGSGLTCRWRRPAGPARTPTPDPRSARPAARHGRGPRTTGRRNRCSGIPPATSDVPELSMVDSGEIAARSGGSVAATNSWLIAPNEIPINPTL